MEKQLGVAMWPGGEHPAMGTHNRLLRLGENTYLEVIAVNPAAGKPQRPRWFGLDRLMPDSPPRLAAWVARTADIESTFSASVEPLGTLLPMRRGDLAWRISVPNDGDVIFGGIVPMLIEWQTRTHPASRLPDSGCDLEALEGVAAVQVHGGLIEEIRVRVDLHHAGVRLEVAEGDAALDRGVKEPPGSRRPHTDARFRPLVENGVDDLDHARGMAEPVSRDVENDGRRQRRSSLWGRGAPHAENRAAQRKTVYQLRCRCG